MNLIRSLALTGLLALVGAPADAGSRIYKTVDKDGNVVFTDVPPPNPKDPVKLNQTNEYSPEVEPRRNTIRRSVPFTEAEEETDEIDVSGYEQLSISAPQHEEAIRDNAGNITVSVNLAPGLKQGDTLEILLDGKVVASGSQTEVMLENVDRGTHEVSARVIEQSGNAAISAEPTTFHLLRYSALQGSRTPSPRRAQ